MINDVYLLCMYVCVAAVIAQDLVLRLWFLSLHRRLLNVNVLDWIGGLDKFLVEVLKGTPALTQ